MLTMIIALIFLLVKPKSRSLLLTFSNFKRTSIKFSSPSTKASLVLDLVSLWSIDDLLKYSVNFFMQLLKPRPHPNEDLKPFR